MGPSPVDLWLLKPHQTTEQVCKWLKRWHHENLDILWTWYPIVLPSAEEYLQICSHFSEVQKRQNSRSPQASPVEMIWDCLTCGSSRIPPVDQRYFPLSAHERRDLIYNLIVCPAINKSMEDSNIILTGVAIGKPKRWAWNMALFVFMSSKAIFFSYPIFGARWVLMKWIRASWLTRVFSIFLD